MTRCSRGRVPRTQDMKRLFGEGIHRVATGEITEVNLAYIASAATGQSRKCVALSDESKGAALETNLARDFAPLSNAKWRFSERTFASLGRIRPQRGEMRSRTAISALEQRRKSRARLVSRAALAFVAQRDATSGIDPVAALACKRD